MPLGILDHQVNVKGKFCQRPQGTDDGLAKRNFWHESSVHHVDVNGAGAALFYFFNGFRQTAKVGRKQRRSQNTFVFHCAIIIM